MQQAEVLGTEAPAIMCAVEQALVGLHAWKPEALRSVLTGAEIPIRLAGQSGQADVA